MLLRETPNKFRWELPFLLKVIESILLSYIAMSYISMALV